MSDKIFVTGGAGYIGAHTCKTLAKAGYTPIVFDNLSTGHAYAVKWGPFIQADLADRHALNEAFNQYKPKAVIHFAASALVVESVADPGKYYRNNVVNTLNLLEAMKDHGVKKLVFSSTCATYGNPLQTPILEDHPQNPVNPYGKSKLMVEQMIKDFQTAHGLQAVILRYFNVAGADLETHIGENHTPETHLIPSVIQAALGIKDEIVVYGTDFQTPDGSAIRDYIHVNDLADAHVQALNYPHNDCFNLGTGTGYSVLEILDAVQKFCGKTLPVRLAARRSGEPAILTADNAKAKNLLNWNPKHSDLTVMIESAWKWHQLLHENANLLKSALSKC
jgi:UDP-arabinose 4-epimerase